MHLEICRPLKAGWKIYAADDASLLKIDNGEELSYVAAFGKKTDLRATPCIERISELDAISHSFSLLVSDSSQAHDDCFLVLVSLQEGDDIERETLELIEMHAATYTVRAPVRGCDLVFFHVVRDPADLDGFKILALLAPKMR
jgi:hypothetical protein